MIGGIDVSHNNGAVDWAKVASTGVAFAYVKASQGQFSKDQLFAANYAAAKQNQILRGAYHFFSPRRGGQEQAENFLSVVGELAPGDLPPALDVEECGEQSASALAAAIQRWLEAVQQRLGRTPVIYTSASFWNAALGGTAAFAGYPLWVAHYTSNALPNMPVGFSNFIFWQYSDAGNVAGITGKVDLDWFQGSMAELRQLAGLAGS